MSCTHELSNVEILDVIGRVLEKLAQPVADADVFRILDSLPATCSTFARLLGALAVRSAALTLEAADVDRSSTVEVELVSFMPPDDVPEFAKTAAELVRLGCGFLLAGPDDDPAAQALNEASHAAAHRGPEFAFLALTELLGRIRRLMSGDTREVITS
ncbi:hypothetical protein [Promicromonospora sp. NPDC023805]|uniref:hypothetical protein n=1 Tax=Promicromonospora sp. NPDC023805 TaxID=3154696 RepID=UPI0033C36617